MSKNRQESLFVGNNNEVKHSLIWASVVIAAFAICGAAWGQLGVQIMIWILIAIGIIFVLVLFNGVSHD